MSSFTDPLEVRQIPGDGMWETTRAFTYWTDCDPDLDDDLPLSSRCTTSYAVPAGFVTDFASIPSIAWPVIGHPAGRYAQASVLHDKLYREPVDGISRARADWLFLEAMAVLKVPAWKRWAMWLAVRIGGWAAFNDETRTQQ